MNRTDRTFHTETGSETAIRDTHWTTDAERWDAVTRREPQADGDRDRWFSAEEAKEYGFVDHVFERSVDAPGEVQA
mgnify:CR=1 FL=1